MINTNYLEQFNSPIRQISGKVGLSKGSTITQFGEIIKADHIAPYTDIEVNAESKNLFDCANAKTIAANATAITSKTKNKIIVSNSNVNKYQYISFILSDTLENKTITLSGNWVASGSNNGCLRIEWVKDDSSTVGSTIAMLTTSGNSVSATVRAKPEGATKLALFVYANLNGTAAIGDTVEYSNIQIELGTTATPYAPCVDWEATKPKKNIIKQPYHSGSIVDTAYTINGVEFTPKADGSVIANGTATANAIFWFYARWDGNFYSGNYVVSGCEESADYWVAFETHKRDGSWHGSALTATGRNHYLYLDDCQMVSYIYIKQGATVNNKVFYPQIEPGTVATEYEPYIPVPVNEIKAYGKNWAQINSVSAPFSKEKTIIFEGKISGDFVLSWKHNLTNLNNTTSAVIGWEYEDRSIGYDASITYSKGFVVFNNKVITRIFVLNYCGAQDGSVYNIQLELGTTATEYEPYKEPGIYSLTAPTTLTIQPISATTTLIPSSGIIMNTSHTTIIPGEEYTNKDNIKSIKINRECESGKFFGFGVSQKLTIELLDKDRNIDITKNDRFNTYFKINDNDFINTFPSFYVEETKRNENTNDLTITAYDSLFAAVAHKFSEISLSRYTIRELASAIASIMCLTLEIRGFSNEEIFNTYFENGAKFEGTETFREVLDDIAEYTQSIYYISGNSLVFRRLGTEPAATIEKKHYFTLKSKDPITLGSICNTNELGNSTTHHSLTPGMTQYIRDNAFYATFDDETVAKMLREDIDIYGITAYPVECSWRGNFLLEIGDKISITTKDNSLIATYYLNDNINYQGGFSQNTTWKDTEEKVESHTNSSSLGSLLKQTYAKVDKANKKIEMVVSETSANKNEISILQQDTKSISGSVSSLDKKIDNTSNSLTEISKKVEATMTDEQIQLAITTEIAKGTNKVETTTGFTFDENGLKVSKTGKDMDTQITENGMVVSKSGTAMLTANSDGVEAKNLNASTYLIVGKNSRFEDYGNRTACFWIGG